MNILRKALLMYGGFVSPSSVQDEEAAELLAERRRAAIAAAVLGLLVFGAGLYAVIFLDAQRDNGGCGQPNCIALISS